MLLFFVYESFGILSSAERNSEEHDDGHDKSNLEI